MKRLIQSDKLTGGTLEDMAIANKVKKKYGDKDFKTKFPRSAIGRVASVRYYDVIKGHLTYS